MTNLCIYYGRVEQVHRVLCNRHTYAHGAGSLCVQLYEAHGELMAVTTKKTKLSLKKTTTYEEYLAMPAARDVEATVPLNLSTAITGSSEDKVAQAFADRSKASRGEASTSSSAGSEQRESSSKFYFSSMGFSGGSRSKNGASTQAPDPTDRASSQDGADAAGRSDPVRVQVAGTGRTVRARMWLTPDAPINQKQLLPLLDIAGSTNQYIIKVLVLPLTMLGAQSASLHSDECVCMQICNFMEKYGSLQLFPVKVQVPLIMSLRATLHVKNMQLWGGGDQPSTSTLRPPGMSAHAGTSTGQPTSPPGIEFWEPPAHYKHISLDELDANHLAKRAAAKRAAREKKETARREKRRSATGSTSQQGSTSGSAHI